MTKKNRPTGEKVTQSRRKRKWKRAVRRGLHNRMFATGLIILIPLVFAAIAAPLLSPYDPLEIDAERKLQSPNADHLLGTDELGRDVLSRVLYGARISLRVGASATVLTAIFGVFLGSIAGYYRAVDGIISRIVDGLMIFPGLLLGIMLMAALGPAEANVVLAMVILYTPRIIRVVRGSVLEVKELEYIDASRMAGAGGFRILFSHIVPATMAPLFVQITFGFAWAILVETGLSFLGLGTPPPAPSWGNIISDGRNYVRTTPMLMMAPGIAITMAVLGLNLIGDGLRDLLDPRLKAGSAKIEVSSE